MTAIHKHHRKMRSQGGDDSYGNLIELPLEIHQLVHENPVVAYDHGLLVRSNENPHAIRPDVPGFLQSLGVESEPEKKPARKRKEGTERRKRRRISINVPNDSAEDGGGIYDDTLEEVKQRLFDMGLINPDEYPDPQTYPAYEATIAAWRDWLNTPRAYEGAETEDE